MSKFLKTIELNQGYLEDVVHKIFPGINAYSNVRKETNIRNDDTGSLLEIDVWVPAFNLSFEFQDAYHYVPTWDSDIPLSLIQKRDNKKREEVIRRGHSLIVVPCWWNGTEESLIASIRFLRPDMFSNLPPPSVSPIPLNPPIEYFDEEGLPFIGNLMLASFPRSNFQETITPQNPWWMGEKYDGIRCCWVYQRKKLYSRYGVDLELPQPFFEQAPSITLDGEIWFGRGMFQDSQRIVWLEASMEDWISVRNVVFDVPDILHANLPFELRYSRLLSKLSYDNPFFISATRVMITRTQQVQESLNNIIVDGGEGVILRKPKSFYEKGRSTLLLKLKASRADREALVTDLDESNSLILQIPEGETFKVKSESVTSSTYPQIGDIVTFSYENYSRYAVPVDPKVTRIRPDLDWKDVVQSFHEDSQAQDLNEITQKLLIQPNLQQKTHGFWKTDQFVNLKQLLLQFASSRNFDPLVASNWYSVSQRDIVALKGGASALQSFKGSHIKAIALAFPNIGLDESLFENLSRNYWNSMDNRKNFFVDFAEKQGFDPLVAENWYSKKNQISLEPKAASVLTHYNKSPISALIHLFPDIGLDPNKFDDTPNLFRVNSNARRFLDKFAQEAGFDPLIPDNWYSVTSDDIRRAKGGSLLVLYNNSLQQALMELYPDIQLDSSKFDNVSRNYWDSRDNKRRFFDEFAESHKFNPLNPENWYGVTTRMVRKTKRGSSVLHHYRGSVVRAVQDVYPEVTFDPENFGGLPRYYWFDVDNHRDFLENFAQSNGFDPLVNENWYKVDGADLLGTKGASLLQYYETFLNAIVKNFPELHLDPNKFKQSMKRFAKKR